MGAGWGRWWSGLGGERCAGVRVRVGGCVGVGDGGAAGGVAGSGKAGWRPVRSSSVCGYSPTVYEALSNRATDGVVGVLKQGKSTEARWW